MRSILILMAAIFSVGTGSWAGAEPSYPELDAKQLGNVRHIVASANQLRGDWRYLEPRPDAGFDAYQYQLAFMSYTLALVQTEWTPAYRELYHEAQRKLIEKFLEPEVWGGWWLEVIKYPDFMKYLDPAKEWRDPVREKNIMYSGHLLQMISLYETLYGDERYDRTGAIVFEFPGPDGFRHAYDHHSLARLIHRQFIDSGFVGIECEPNHVFAECNQHPILGLMQYDQPHGTDLSDVRFAFWKKATELGYIVPESRRTMFFYRVAERERIDQPFAMSDGWTGVSLHGWNRELAARLYPVHRDAELAALVDQSPQQWSRRWAHPMVTYDFGFLAAYAAEVGDRHTAQQLVDYADKHFRPVWVDGRYFYPRRDVITGDLDSVFANSDQPALPPNRYGDHEVGTLEGVMLLFARLNPGQGIWRLYNEITPANFARSGEPEAIKVRLPETTISQAYYDRSRRRLAVKAGPGTDYSGETTLATIRCIKLRKV